MPEHVHLLVKPAEPGPSIGRYLARVKQPVSRQVRELLARHDHDADLLRRLTVRERPGKTCFRFWQEGPGYDRNLHSSRAIEASLDYLHENPVRRGLCRRAVDWRWSSARFYREEPPCRQRPPLPYLHGLPADALA